MLVDTNVYIDALQDCLPTRIEQLISIRQLNHSSIAVGELAFAIGRLDPADERTVAAIAEISGVIGDIRPHRLKAPTHHAIINAYIASGVIARLQGHSSADRRKLLSDAILFFQSLEEGRVLLTRNIADFDYLLQIEPAGRVLFYRH